MTKIQIKKPANIYLLKVNNKNTRKNFWNMFKVNNKVVNDFLLVTLLSNLITFHTFF